MKIMFWFSNIRKTVKNLLESDIKSFKGKIDSIVKELKRTKDWGDDYTSFNFVMLVDQRVNKKDRDLAEKHSKIKIIDKDEFEYYEELQNLIKSHSKYDFLGELGIKTFCR